jgi:hypothetical protein
MRVKRIHPKGNVTLMSLLKQGCCIDFDDEVGSKLRGDPRTKYIEVYALGSYQGCWLLTDEGLRQALNDLDRTRRDAVNAAPWKE